MQQKNDAKMETFATKNIAKIDKYKKNWTALLRRNIKQTWTLLKLTNTEKLNSTSMTEHKKTWTLLKFTNTKNWTALLPRRTKQKTTALCEPSNKHTQIQQKSNKR